MNGKFVRKTLTHTQTLSSGLTLVILGVPALCDEDGFCFSEPEVVERLYDLIKAAAAQEPLLGETVRVIVFGD